MAEEAVDTQHSTALSIYEKLEAKLERTTDPAQIVVLESCLEELRDELGELAPSR